MEDSKKWWASKSIWVNMIMAIVAIFSAALPEVELFEKVTPEVFISIFSGVNMLLRFVTTKPIEFK